MDDRCHLSGVSKDCRRPLLVESNDGRLSIVSNDFFLAVSIITLCDEFSGRDDDIAEDVTCVVP